VDDCLVPILATLIVPPASFGMKGAALGERPLVLCDLKIMNSSFSFSRCLGPKIEQRRHLAPLLLRLQVFQHWLTCDSPTT